MISQFKEMFEDRYQDTFHKVLVGRMIANYRLEAGLRRGGTVHRFAIDMSGVKVRTITPLVDRTIDPITNTDETLTIDQYKGTTFPVSEWEETLHGNPDLGMLYGREAGILIAEYLDATILSQVRNAAVKFDTGDLTTMAASGVPIDLTTTNVPKLITRAKAKLGSRRIRGGNMAWVVDDYVLATYTETQLGRDTSMADSFYKNGMSGTILGDEVYVSDNLTGEARITLPTNVTADQTFEVQGVVFTAKATPANPGEFDIGADADATRAILANAINGAATGQNSATGYFEVSAANRAILDAARLTASNDNTTNVLTLVGIGSGRLSVASNITDNVIVNFVHMFYGQKGAIDVVVAKEVKMKMRQEPKQDTTNIFNDIMFGLKVFADGARKMLDVWVQA